MEDGMDRLDAMSAFLAAVETGSLSGASRKLGMPLATVSRKVSELEAYLRTRLVNRTSRRLILTDAGRSYVTACKQILEDIDEAERAAAGEYSLSPRRSCSDGSTSCRSRLSFSRLIRISISASCWPIA